MKVLENQLYLPLPVEGSINSYLLLGVHVIDLYRGDEENAKNALKFVAELVQKQQQL